jgi:hypothetical protein
VNNHCLPFPATGIEILLAKQLCTGPSTGSEIFVRGVRTFR